MNKFIKATVILTLFLSAVLVHIGMMVFGFVCAFTPNFYFIYNLTPFVGLIVWICIIKCAMLVLKSNPTVFLKETASKIKDFFSK